MTLHAQMQICMTAKVCPIAADCSVRCSLQIDQQQKQMCRGRAGQVCIRDRLGNRPRCGWRPVGIALEDLDCNMGSYEVDAPI